MKMEHPVNRLNRIQKEIKNPIGNWGVGYIAELMQKYAEEYHQSKVNNVVLDDVNEPFYCDIIEGEEGYRCKEQCMSCRSIEDKLTKQ